MSAFGTGSSSSEPNLSKKESLSNSKSRINQSSKLSSYDDKSGSNFGIINEMDEDDESVTNRPTNFDGVKINNESESEYLK